MSLVKAAHHPARTAVRGSGTHQDARALPVIRVALALAIAATLALAGCGYSHRPLYAQDVETVAVPIFQNRTFYQDLGFDVTEALVKEIELRTPYKVVAGGHADTVLTGTIVGVEQERLSRRRETAVPQEMEMVIVVNFEWKDLRSGRILRDRRGFEAVGRYLPTQPFGEPMALAEHQAAQALAREIVSVMRSDW